MASIMKVGNSWRAQVRIKALPHLSKHFETEEQAREWAETYERTALPNELPLEVAALPRHFPWQHMGVYFLFRRDQCMYVGQSKAVHQRVLQHTGRIPFDSYAWIQVGPEQLSEVENKYIKLLQPPHNVRSNYSAAMARGWALPERKAEPVTLNLLHEAQSPL